MRHHYFGARTIYLRFNDRRTNPGNQHEASSNFKNSRREVGFPPVVHHRLAALRRFLLRAIRAAFGARRHECGLGPERAGHILRAVKARVSIPVAVKLSPYFSALGTMAVELGAAGADGLVLFNRFYQLDIDVVGLKIRNDLELSQSSEMRLPLLWLGVLHDRVKPSLAASTGVHTVDDVVKYLLAGADVVMTTSALLQQGIGHMRYLRDGLEDWLKHRDRQSLMPIRGLLSQRHISDPAAYERANYIRILGSYRRGAG